MTPASMTGSEILRRRRTGEAVRDLQQRLAAAGHLPVGDEGGVFGAGTEVALRAFQEARGIRVDGICGPETWAALVESGFALGDRMLYESSPNLRGDDVADLQHRLNVLGFDAGREDGILGHRTSAALREFQRNTGLAVDGILGPETLDAFGRVATTTDGSVAAVREREELRHPRRLEDHRVYVAVAPEFQTLGDVVGRALSAAGAQTITDLSGEDDSTIAGRANQYHADLFLAVRAGDRSGCRCHYFASGAFRSEAGFRVAQAIQAELDAVLGPPAGAAEDDGPCGRTFAILRETRMAAVVCEPVGERDVQAMGALVAAVADVGAAIARGIQRGIEEQPAD